MLSTLPTCRSTLARSSRGVVSLPQDWVLAHAGLRSFLCDALMLLRRGEAEGEKEVIWLPQDREQEEKPWMHGLHVCVPPNSQVEILMPV